MTLLGYVDGYADGRVRGWALDTRAPDSPVEVLVYDDAALAGAGLANRYRYDLTAVKADGRCAFEIAAELRAPERLRAMANGKALERSSGFVVEAEPNGRQSRSRFELRAPSHENAIDLFKGSWAATPDTPLDEWSDRRVDFAAKWLGTHGRFDGQRILELGPLEGRHTVLLERLGAEVVAIEANADAFLKCLIVKEIAGMTRARFMLGDVVEHLKTAPGRYDMVFCSGVLYHMSDPLSLIGLIARVTDRCLVWTHVYDEACYAGPARRAISDPRFPRFELWEAGYGSTTQDPRFWGGNRQTAVWMRERDVLEAFRANGLQNISPVQRSETGGNASILFTAARQHP